MFNDIQGQNDIDGHSSKEDQADKFSKPDSNEKLSFEILPLIQVQYDIIILLVEVLVQNPFLSACYDNN